MIRDNVVPVPARAGIPDVAGDHLNSRRFLQEYGHLVRRSPELGRWYLWNGAWFEEDRLERVLDLAANTIDNLRVWVTEAESPDDFRKRSRHYEASAKSGRRDALLAIVGTDPEIAVGVEELDSHPYLLACRNGTVDLCTGELRPAEPADLLTRGIDVDYDPNATSELWRTFIQTTFAGDEDLIGFVQRLLGYCCTGVVNEHLLPMFHGQGSNGKSTLVGVVLDLLSDHAMTAPEGLVIHHDHEPHPERIASLRGRRLVVSIELEQRTRLAEVTVKMLTGGDTLSARELYGRRFNFQPTHKIVLVTNHRPRIPGTDHAMWRRVKLVPFEVVIPDESQDGDLRRRLRHDHGPAVLAWLVQGALDWHRSGIGAAAAVTAATAEYRAEQDHVGRFIADCCVEDPNGYVSAKALRETYEGWCAEQGEPPWSAKALGVELANRGFDSTQKGTDRARTWLGIGLVGEGVNG